MGVRGVRRSCSAAPAMALRAVALLAAWRGAVAQCTITGIAAPTNGQLPSGCDGTLAVGDTATCQYTCDAGYRDTGTQASCSGTSTWNAGDPECTVMTCRVTGVSGVTVTSGELAETCTEGLYVEYGDETTCQYTCDFGYSEGPSHTAASCGDVDSDGDGVLDSWDPGSPSCLANSCDTIDLGRQDNLSPDMPAVGGQGDNEYRTGLSVTQTKLNLAIRETLNDDTATFTCGAGYQLDTTVEYVCNYETSENGAATFSGQLCTEIVCATCTGTADDATKSCDRDPDTDGTADCPAGCVETAGSTDDAYCTFIQDETDRADGIDCSDSAYDSHVWCRCLQSAASLAGLSDVSQSADANWLNDGRCHQMFNTGACHQDGGDCSGSIGTCEGELQDVIRPACCTSADCSPVPDSVTESCARKMVPFWERCAYEIELPYLPMWVWAGLASHADTILDSISEYCTDDPTASYSVRQRCDARCDCADCSDEITDSNSNACEYPNAPSSFCGTADVLSDNVCTCNSGATIPFEWVCDASDDCGMGEDETASACAENPVNSNLVVWGATFSLTGARRACMLRWGRDVVPDCSGLHTDGAAASSCSVACADKYFDWYVDCKHIVFDDGSAARTSEANEFFDCCSYAQSAGSTRDCEAVATLESCTGDGSTLPIESLGDGNCDTALDCSTYLRDAGDCALSVAITLPFEDVVGTFSASEFVSALTASHSFLHSDDVSVQQYEQTITAELNLGCSYDGAVNAVLLSTPAGTAQLQSGIAIWLGVEDEIVTIDEVTSSSNDDGNEVVNVKYTVTAAPKEISGEFSASASDRRDALLDILYYDPDGEDAEVAQPQAIPIDMGGCSTHFTESAPAPAPEVVSAATSVVTSIRVQVQIVEIEYEFAQGSLTGTDTENLAVMQSAVLSTLQNTETILTNLNAGCESDCITGLEYDETAVEISVEVLNPAENVVAEFTESEVALAIAVIIVLVVGGCACCLVLFGCTVYWYKRKQLRQMILVDEKGNILKEWESEVDTAEREVLMSVLHHYIEDQDRAMKAAQEREEEELIATLEAYEVIEEAIIEVPDEEGNDLLAAAKAEAESAKKERDAKRRKAQERLAKRRAAILEKQKAALMEAGADAAEAEALVAEVVEADADADRHRADLESEFDEKQIANESAKRTEFEAKMAGASSDEERAALEAAYKKDVANMRAQMDTERSSQRAKLNDRLKKRKAAVQAKVDEKLEGKGIVGGAEEQAEIEAEAAAEIVDDDTAGLLSAAFDKDAEQLKATRDAKRAAAQEKLQERRKAMAAKHKRELMDAGTPAEVAEKQMKELDDLAELEAKQMQQQDHVMKKKEAAALADLKAKHEAELAQAESDELRSKMAADFSKEQAQINQQNRSTRQKQRSKLNERLAKRQQQLQVKHKAELETVAPEAVQIAEQQTEQRAALAELQKKLSATQAELTEEKAQHQAALDALAAKHDEELRMQKHKFEAMKREFDELSKQTFEHVETAGFAGDEHAAATQAVLGEYQMSLEAATKRTNASKVESKAALQKRLADRRRQMEPKVQAAMQKIAEVEEAQKK